MSKARMQRWAMIVEDRPEDEESFYTKEEISDNLEMVLLTGLTLKSIKKESK